MSSPRWCTLVVCAGLNVSPMLINVNVVCKMLWSLLMSLSLYPSFLYAHNLINEHYKKFHLHFSRALWNVSGKQTNYALKKRKVKLELNITIKSCNSLYNLKTPFIRFSLQKLNMLTTSDNHLVAVLAR